MSENTAGDCLLAAVEERMHRTGKSWEICCRDVIQDQPELELAYSQEAEERFGYSKKYTRRQQARQAAGDRLVALTNKRLQELDLGKEHFHRLSTEILQEYPRLNDVYETGEFPEEVKR